MPNFGSLLQLMKYAPSVIGMVQQFRGQQTKDTSEDIQQTKDALDDLRKNLQQRLEEVENTNARLRSRMKEIESGFTIMKIFVYISSVLALIALIVALVAVMLP